MKKTLTGILLAATAAVMTLSTAVFAADTVKVTPSASEVKVGDTVTVTVTHIPEGVTGYEYTVKYDPTVLSTDADSDHDGSFKQVKADLEGKTLPTNTLTFKALKEGTSDVTLSDIDLGGKNGTLVNSGDATTASTNVKVVTETTPTPTPTPSTDAKTNTDTTKKDADTTKAETKADADKTKTSLKSAKTGFDAMYLVYLAAAVLVAGGVVAVAKRK